MDEVNQIYKYERRITVILALIIGTLITAFVTWRIQLTAQARAQEHIAQEVLRFHVLANSNSEEDQTLKMEVKEEVLDYLEQDMPQSMNIDETRDWMRRHTKDLEEISKQTLLNKGTDWPVSVAVTTAYFPEKTYGDVTFPAGNYEALRIEIGAAKGNNWWCVLYPNLCFLDATNAVVPQEGKEKLKNVLTEDEYSQVTTQSDFKIKWYFLDLFKGEDKK